MMPSLLFTKLQPPAVPPKQVPRPHLHRRLNDGLAEERPFTLVSAPAGFGKTTCISAWVRTLDLPVAWLSLDPADNNPGRFFTYLVAALQQVDAAIGREVEAVLRAGQLPPAEQISAVLVNDMLALNGRFLLVIDDFQIIEDPTILQVMKQLVTNHPPALHLTLLTREDPSLPLARLRANNRMTEIRAADLRFSGSESGRFLNDVMALNLSSTDVTHLVEQTEGWVVGLQLAAIALQAPLSGRGHKDTSHFISRLNGSHRYILNYLTEEVLNQQSPEIQAFLLQTSILDRLHGELCDAVTGRNDSHQLLQQIFHANLFLIPLEDGHHWYRYHHLFADSLRDRQRMQEPTGTAVLHRRAADWYAQAKMPIPAIQHALAAEDYETAVRLIENHAIKLIMQWHVKAVKEWIGTLPPEWSAQSSKINLAFAWTHLLHGDFMQAAPYLERLQTNFAHSQGDEDLTVQAEWLALQTVLLNAQGKPTPALALAQQALAIVPTEANHVRSLIYLGLAGAHQQLAQDGEAMAAYRQLIHHGRAAGNLVTELLGISGLVLLALEHGRLHLACEHAIQGVNRIEQLQTLPPVSMAVYGEVGEVLHQWGRLEEAHAFFRRATEVSTLSGYSDAELYHAVVRSRLALIAGDLPTATQAIEEAVALMQTVGPVAVREELLAQQVRVSLVHNQITAAEAALQQDGFFTSDNEALPALAADEIVAYSQGLLYNSALRILLHRTAATGETAELQQGMNRAERLLSGALQRRLLPIALETLLLRARMHVHLGDEPAGLADVASALELAEPEGFITIFVAEGSPVARMLAKLLTDSRPENVDPDYIQQILGAFPKEVQPKQRPPSPDIAGAPGAMPVEPLTNRELEILHLIQTGASNREIAERLTITLHTVKKHNSNIYGKLGVTSRTQAVARALEIGLL